MQSSTAMVHLPQWNVRYPGTFHWTSFRFDAMDILHLVSVLSCSIHRWAQASIQAHLTYNVNSDIYIHCRHIYWLFVLFVVYCYLV
ncbi:protein KEI1 [Kluyveromyces marxianus]|uniref:Protein KEI1 n=1 Tax=Kluyveromyces marxianus TaxID=4911 RepID=A0ABX6F1R8_KLUMA|nr:protein KEI1 [Kluyveromyces marxianus]